MSWDKVREIVGESAPTLGALFGGPLGAAAGALVANTLGVKNDPDAVLKALGNPDNIVKLKELDIAQQKANQDYEIALYSEDTKDRDSARQREMAVKDTTPRNLAYAIVGSFIAMSFGLLFGEAKADSALIGAIIGYLSAKAEQVVAFYYGSSHSSSAKNDLIDRLTKK